MPDEPEEQPDDWQPAPDPGALAESEDLDDLLNADGSIK